MQVRLLGGSRHQKKMEVARHERQIVIQRLKKPKGKWTPAWSLDIDVPIEVDTEFYELKKMYKAEQINDKQVHIETKIAYVKKGSIIKPETFWKLAFPHEKYIDWGTVGPT